MFVLVRTNLRGAWFRFHDIDQALGGPAARRRFPVVAAVAAACLVAQVPAVASADLQQDRQQAEHRREQVDDRLDSARSDLAETRRRQQGTLSRLEKIDNERTTLEAELDRLTTELDAAEALLAEAEQALRSTQAEIEVNTAELTQTQRDLERQKDRVRARARATFMYGSVNYPETVLDVETANDLGASLQYMRSLVSADQNQAQQIATLERKYEAAIGRLKQLRAAQDEARAQHARERNRVAELVEQRQRVAEELESQAAEHEAVLADLESDEQRYAAAIDALEAESDEIEDRLADLAAQQRRGEPTGSSAGAGTPAGSSGSFQWPVNGPVTSGFGYRTHPVLGTQRLHAGVDFGAATGTPIVAATDGTVVSAGWQGGYGNAVIIDHGGGEATLYGHQSRLAVSSGASVSRGQIIGYVGSTGMSTGPHLHFELRINGVPTDPMPRL
jgi:murein DD-endopeptidase MepM/ murein hydrolase activator NlpD